MTETATGSAPSGTPEPLALDKLCRSLMDGLIEGCQVIGFDLRYVYVNQAVATHGRTTREALVGCTMMEAYPGIEDTAVFGLIRACLEQRCNHELENEFTFPDGSKGWFELRIQAVPEGVFILSLDITARKLAEERVAHLNALLRGIRSVGQLIIRERDPMALLRQAGELLVEARGFWSCLVLLRERQGTWRHAAVGRPEETRGMVSMLGSGELPECLRRVIEGPETVVRSSPEVTCVGCSACDGRPAYRDTAVARLGSEDLVFGAIFLSGPPGFASNDEEMELIREVARDLGFALRNIEREEQLLFAQRMESVGRLAGGVAHDFNNLLMVINSYAELSLDLLPEDSPVTSYIGQIRRAGNRAAGLTRQLLAFSRRQVLRTELVPLNAVIENMVGMLRRLIGEDVQFTMTLGGDVGLVKADAGQLEQVVVNLVVNARDAMPGGGRLAIATSNVVLDEDRARHHPSVPAGAYVLLSVTDTGKGMDPATRTRVFEPFFTTKDVGKGTGLGLSTVYGIVKQSGGDVSVYSEPGLGSTFKVYLPRPPEEGDVRPDVVTPVTRPSRGECVLIVEDDAAVRELSERALVAAGYRVVAARDGAEALAMVDRGLGPLHLLLTDVVMPGMNGRQLADALGERCPGLRVIYTSGYTDDAIVDHGVLEAGRPFLSKPFALAELTRKVRDVLDGA